DFNGHRLSRTALQDRIRLPQRTFHEGFIDFCKAFNSLKTIQTKRCTTGSPPQPPIVQRNHTQISLGCKIHGTVSQECMVIGSHDIKELQKRINVLETWTERKEFQINLEKTENRTRDGNSTYPPQTNRGITVTIGQTLLDKMWNCSTINSPQVFIEFCKAFDSLNRNIVCLKLDPMVEKNKELAILTHSILNLQKRINALETWAECSELEINSEMTENVKSRILKSDREVSKYTSSRLAHKLADSLNKLLEDREEKRKEIWQNFYLTEAMMNRSSTSKKPGAASLCVNSIAALYVNSVNNIVTVIILERGSTYLTKLVVDHCSAIVL
ncbi:hypothetical protein L9F63_017396, partial [Diploptera punctata]